MNWISVLDKLPDRDQRVLVYQQAEEYVGYKWEGVLIAYYVKHHM